MNGGLTYEGQTRLSLNSAICWKGSSEGSLLVSLVINNKLTHGLALQPEFNIVQHGSVHKKSGSEDNLHDYVLPYFEKYVVVYSSKYKSEIWKKFRFIVSSLYNHKNKALSKENMVSLIKLIYSYNPEGKGKQRKRTLEEALDLLNHK
ncbi:hypothetical protein OnM2_021015 [Erysiphe neolycopersici]|uniref:LAGLIDADG endonuclease n=1 Tax=Erysiphe neolycopersici TaxID=212602 RepID=A0A420I2R1_9PEZI|nr:hypothetical protein OnM2_021015 [Erysiphe neolycopersici]